MTSTFVQRLLLAGLCILFMGCTVYENVRRTMIIEPAGFNWKKDKRRSMALYSQWADEAWLDELQCFPDLAARPDYSLGFRDGFVDYTYAGGTGEPPPVPPRTLWNVAFRSDDGHRRTMDWYEGYRHGARVSRDGGYRSMATIRSSLFGYPPRDEIPAATLLPDVVGFPSDHFPGTEVLPLPDSNGQPENSAPAINPSTAPPADRGKEKTTTSREATPARKPALPPVPSNLPPAAPRATELDEPKEFPALDDAPAHEEPAEPATDKGPAPDIEPVPLSIPPTPIDAGPPAGAATGTSPPVDQPTTTSLRIVGLPTATTGAPVRSAVAKPMPIHRPPLGNDRPTRRTTPQETGVRLAVATSEAPAPVAAQPPTTTVKVRQGWNMLRGPGSSQPTPAVRPLVLE